MANAELLCVAIDHHVIFSHYLLTLSSHGHLIMGAAAQRRASVDIRRRRAAPASCSFISLPPSSGSKTSVGINSSRNSQSPVFAFDQ